MRIDRRSFIATGAAAALPLHVNAATPQSFSFVHFTDSHIQPELHAEAGTRAAVERMAAVEHDFALAGGDLVMDVYEQSSARASLLFDIYKRATSGLPKRVYSVLGNHDIYGIATKSGVAATDPLYAKKLFEDRLGQPRFQSFDHKGWHFILLDSVQTNAAREWFGEIDSLQLAWLAADIAKLDKATPIVVLTHMPLATATAAFYGAKPDTLKTLMVTNTHAVLKLFAGYNLKAVLQGHTHVREHVEFHDTHYLTPGAVCGNWWKGAFMDSPEGFAVLTAHGTGLDAKLTHEFRASGWKATA